ncbi:hypothetical protein [Streptomyces altiplanensis]
MKPLAPRAVYFPDFLTPPEGAEGLDAGLEAILRTPRQRIMDEMDILDRTNGAPPRAPRLAETDTRRELVHAMRTYYDTVIAPLGAAILRANTPAPP